MGLAGMGMHTMTVQGPRQGTTWQTGDVPPTPEPESLRDSAARLLSTLQSSRESLVLVHGYEVERKGDEKPVVKPGLEQLLRECNELAAELSRMSLGLTERIGTL